MSKPKEKTKLRLVVRRLPAQLTEEQFKNTVQKHLDYVDFWYFVSGQVTDKKVTNSSAYLNFTTQEALQQFWQEFNGHMFITSRGKELKTIIDYAPYQKVPRQKKKVDNRENTIESDPEYLAFVEKLKEPQVLLPSAEEQLDRRLALERETGAPLSQAELIAPLVLYLREKRALKASKGRDRAERRKKVKDRGKDKKEDKPKEKKKEVQVKRKKKDDKPEDDKSKEKTEKEDKRPGRNGVRMVRKQIEPGTVSILKEKTGTPEIPQPVEPIVQQSSQNNGTNRKPRTDPRDRDKRKNDQPKLKYAPKRQDANPQAIKVAGNQ